MKLLIFVCLVSCCFSLECYILENEKCTPRDSLIKTNPYGDIRYYPFVLKIKKCLGSCDTFQEPMLKNCFSNVTEDIYVKVYDFIKQKFIAFKVQRDINCSCNCKFSKKVCRPEQTWNKDLCRCEPFIIPNKIKSINSVDDECTKTVVPSKLNTTNFKFCTRSTQKRVSDEVIILIVSLCLTCTCIAILLRFYLLLKRKLITKTSGN